MASLDVLHQTEDQRIADTHRFAALRLLLAEYRRAVAAEAFYEQLRCASRPTSSRKVARPEIPRAVFERHYAGEAD